MDRFLRLIPAGIAIVFVLILILRYHIHNAKQKSHIAELEKTLSTLTRTLDNSTQALTKARSDNHSASFALPVVDQMHYGVICIDRNRTVALINPFAATFLGGEARTGKPYQQIIRIYNKKGEPDHSVIESAYIGTAQDIPEGSEIAGSRGNLPITGTAFPLRSDDTSIGVAVVFEDNSKNAERAIEEQAFFSAAAHELRTPLTVIRMTVSMLKTGLDSVSPAKLREYIERIDETSEQLLKLVNDFLNISRIEQGRLEIKREVFDIAALTDEVFRELTPLARARNLYMQHTAAEDGFAMTLGDKTKAKEVLTNLISNAVKYTIRGGVTVSHKTAGASIATHVSDTGPGIPEEYRRMLFKRFGQVGSARTMSSSKSTGLGLYISKKLAHLIQGDVQLEQSEPGKGSTFTFTLPAGG